MEEKIFDYIKTYCRFSRIQYGEYREDIMQDMAVNVLTSLNNYDSSKGTLKNYIYGICSNTERRYLRNVYRDKDKIPYHTEDLTDSFIEEGKEDDYFDNYYAKDIIEKAIFFIEKENKSKTRKISTKNMYKYIIMYIQGYTQTEIAKAFNTTQRDVFLRLNHFRRILAKMYDMEV